MYKEVNVTFTKYSLVVNQLLPFKRHAPGRLIYSECLLNVNSLLYILLSVLPDLIFGLILLLQTPLPHCLATTVKHYLVVWLNRFLFSQCISLFRFNGKIFLYFLTLNGISLLITGLIFHKDILLHHC